MIAGDHVEYSSRGAHYDVNSSLQYADIISHGCAADTGVAFHLHEVAELSDDSVDLLSQFAGRGDDEALAFVDRGVDQLKETDREGRCLACPGLGLADCVPTENDGLDALLLDSAWPFKAVTINPAQELVL